MLNRRTLLKSSIPLALLAEHGLFAEDKPQANMIVHTREPLNSEPQLQDLVKSWLTPNGLFYVRSHAPTPIIDAKTFRLSVEGMVQRPFEISLEQLQSEYKKQTVTATMTCAGNRRIEHELVKPVGGVPWGPGAIGNAQWGGALLSALLKKAGIQEGAKHVWFAGADRIERKDGVIPFGASIPLKKALGDTNEMPGALVAYEMNGEALPADHGFPMRTVVPGFIGARSVKWLGKIVVSDRPSPNHYVATAYKLVQRGDDDEWAAASPLESFAINSVVCTPARGALVDAGKITVSGYALPPGLAGRTIRQVDVSTDDGQTWTPARFTTAAKPFCWRLWTAEVPVGLKTAGITVRATDSAGKAQPKTVPWNLKGYMFNAWHRSPIQVR